MHKFLIVSLILKAAYFSFFLLLSRLVSPSMAASLEMYYSTSRSIANISSLGVGVYILKHGHKLSEIAFHILLQLTLVFFVYHMLIGLKAAYVSVIPVLVVLSPYLYYAYIGQNSIKSAFIKEIHIYPIFLFIVSVFFGGEGNEIALSFFYFIFLFFSLFFFLRNYSSFNIGSFKSGGRKLFDIYRESVSYVYSSLFLMLMNLDRYLFSYLFGEDNLSFYFSFVLLLLPVMLAVQMVEDYCISRKITVSLNVRYLLLLLLLLLLLFHFLYPLYVYIFYNFKLNTVSHLIFLLVGGLVFFEVISKVYGVRLYLAKSNKYLITFGHIMNMSLIITIVFLMNYPYLDKELFVYSYLCLHLFKSFVKMALSYQCHKMMLT